MHPGYIWGDSVKIYFEWQAQERGGDVTWQDIYDERAAETALGYLPHSSEIAGAAVFFASPLAKCITGTALPVNSGHWMPPSVSTRSMVRDPGRHPDLASQDEVSRRQSSAFGVGGSCGAGAAGRTPRGCRRRSRGAAVTAR